MVPSLVPLKQNLQEYLKVEVQVLQNRSLRLVVQGGALSGIGQHQESILSA